VAQYLVKEVAMQLREPRQRSPRGDEDNLPDLVLSEDELDPRELMARLTCELTRKIEDSFAARKAAGSN
jgi:hypothetical protein